MRGVGASLFTGGAAAGVPLAQASTTVASGGGILSNLFNGAAKVLSGGPLGAMTAATGAAPAAATAAATGGLGSVLPAAAATGAADAALVAAPTATGMAPSWKGLGNYLQSEAGASMIAGLGEGIGSYQQIKSYEDMKNADRDYLIDKDRRITESYDVDPSVYVGGPKTREAWKYNPQSGQIESVRA